MIAVYTGKMPSVTISNVQYDRNVPSYVKPINRAVTNDSRDFEIYDKRKKYDGNNRYINLVLPTHFDLFMASLSIIDRCKEWFPNNPIRVHCDTNYHSLIPKTVAIANTTHHVASREIYREFNLHLSSKQRLDLCAQFPKLNLEQILLVKIKMYDGSIDCQLRPKLIDNNVSGKSSIVVFGQGDGETHNIPGLGQELATALPNAKYFPYVDYSKVSEYMEALSEAKFAVFCGETDFCFSAPYMKIPCVIAIGNNRINKDRYLDAFENVTVTYINDQKYSLKEFASKIIKLTGNSVHIETKKVKYDTEPSNENEQNGRKNKKRD